MCYIFVSVVGLDSVLYWFCVDIIFWRGFSVGDVISESFLIIILFLGWFLGSLFNFCFNEYFKRFNFWFDLLNFVWVLNREKIIIVI